MPKRRLTSRMPDTLPSPEDKFREIPDDMEAIFPEEVPGRNNATGAAYSDPYKIELHQGAPSPKKRKEWHRERTPPGFMFRDMRYIGPQPQEMEWALEFQEKGTYPDPLEFEKWCWETFGPACTKEFINLRYKVFQEDIEAVLKAHEKNNKGEMLTAPFSEGKGTPVDEHHGLGIGFGPNPDWYGTDKHYDSLWNEDKPYGPALKDITTYWLGQVKDQLELWQQNGSPMRTW